MIIYFNLNFNEQSLEIYENDYFNLNFNQLLYQGIILH